MKKLFKLSLLTALACALLGAAPAPSAADAAKALGAVGAPVSAVTLPIVAPPTPVIANVPPVALVVQPTTPVVAVPVAPAPTSADAAKALAGAGMVAVTPIVVTPLVAPTPDPTAADFMTIIKEATAAVHGKNWVMLAALILILLVMAVRKYGKNIKLWGLGVFFTSDRGGVILAFLFGLASAVAASLSTGIALTPQVLLDGVHMGILACGGFAALKKLFFPSGADAAAIAQNAGAAAGAAIEAKVAASPDPAGAAAAEALAAVGNTPPPVDPTIVIVTKS